MFAALADPTRRRIMERLSGHGERRVTALAKPFRISLPAISRHLHVLERARLIQRRRQGRIHFIRTRSAGLKEAQKWLMRCASNGIHDSMLWTNSSPKTSERGKRDEIRGEDQRESSADHTHFQRAARKGLCGMENCRPGRALVRLQGFYKGRSPNGFSRGRHLYPETAHPQNVGEYTITGTYDEIIEPEKIVYHVNLGPATTQVTIEFIAQGSHTKVILTQVGFPDENLSRIVSEGTTESLDRLDQILLGQPV